MTEELDNAAETEEVVSSAEPIVTEPEQPKTPKTLPEDQEWNKVELTPEAQKRFNRLYAQVKSQERIQNEIIEQNRKLMDKLETYETKTKTTEHVSKLEQLKAERREYLMSGDLAKADELDEQIFELRSNKPKAPEPKTAEQAYELQPEVKERVVEWANEVDDTGEMLRPFILVGHPKHKTSMAIIESVLQDEALYGKDVEDYVKAVDKALIANGIMKAKRKTEPSVVLESSQRPSAGKVATKLSFEELHVAKRMYPNDPDPAKRYLAAKEKLK